jgi:hypothetical protein
LVFAGWAGHGQKWLFHCDAGIATPSPDFGELSRAADLRLACAVVTDRNVCFTWPQKSPLIVKSTGLNGGIDEI